MTNHPRLLARIAGVAYLVIIGCALFAYLYVRGHLIAGDMTQTARNIVAQQGLYRLGFSAAAVVVVSNPPMGVFLYELLKVVNASIALLALVFLTIATTIEAVNLLDYVAPLFVFTLPELKTAFGPHQLEALARGSIRMFGYGFSISLTFFSVFCGLNGYLILRSTFLPPFLGALLMIAGATYWTNSFALFLALPIPYIPWVTLAAESALALWLLLFGVNEAKWRAQAAAAMEYSARPT
jgi:hypothetical protein